MSRMDARLRALEQRQAADHVSASAAADARAIILARLERLAAQQPPGPPPTEEEVAQFRAYLEDVAARRVAYA